MTILQLKYVLAIANSSSMREAASKLFVSQPALSSTIRELEGEVGIKIFERTNKGISLTNQGIEFISYAKQAVSQYELIEERYNATGKEVKHFSVSMQHYVFAVHAFVNTIRLCEEKKYVYTVRETKTAEVLYNVRDMESEIGIVAYSKNNENVMKKLFREFQLEFHFLMLLDTYVYLWKGHPLADRKELFLEELAQYPCISFDQSGDSDFYITEEALGNYEFEKLIKSTDRATTSEIMVELNGYSVGTGIMMDSVIMKDEIVAIKLKEQDPLMIGYILRKDYKLSDIAEMFIQELKKYKR